MNMIKSTLGAVLVLALMQTAFAGGYLDNKRIEARFRRKLGAFKSSRRRLQETVLDCEGKEISVNDRVKAKERIPTVEAGRVYLDDKYGRVFDPNCRPTQFLPADLEVKVTKIFLHKDFGDEITVEAVRLKEEDLSDWRKNLRVDEDVTIVDAVKRGFPRGGFTVVNNNIDKDTADVRERRNSKLFKGISKSWLKPLRRQYIIKASESKSLQWLSPIRYKASGSRKATREEIAMGNGTYRSKEEIAAEALKIKAEEITKNQKSRQIYCDVKTGLKHRSAIVGTLNAAIPAPEDLSSTSDSFEGPPLTKKFCNYERRRLADRIAERCGW